MGIVVAAIPIKIVKEKSGMEQSERLDYLVKEFIQDSVTNKGLEVPDNDEEKKVVLRSLMNIRMPGDMDKEVLKVQDEYLRERAVEKGIIGLGNIPTVRESIGSTHVYADKISIWQGDITRLKVGAIVNAANSQMLGCFAPMHTCIDNCIHTFAGVQLRQECDRYMNNMKMRYGKRYEEPTGEAVLTGAYNLPADYVIHTVGPIVGGRLNDTHRRYLKKCYESIMQCCIDNNIRSVAFCCISTGVFCFPNDEAARIAVETVSDYLDKYSDRFDRVVFNVFKDYDLQLYENLLNLKNN
jgi:O-acetyl-ADP-ribose deacetylase (regulator of RNase III)